MKRPIISRVWNDLQGYLEDMNSFPNELVFTGNALNAYLFRSMNQAKKWIMTRPAWTIYRVVRLDNNKRMRFKKYVKP